MTALIRKFSLDARGVGGAMLMGLFAVFGAWRWSQSGSLFFALLTFRDLLLSYLFATRQPARVHSGWRDSAVSYISTALPLFYLPPTGPIPAGLALTANLLWIGGFLLATLAAIELGSRIGVSPAVRGERCRAGVYRWFSHPMYVGYMIAEVGWLVVEPWNAVLFICSAVAYWLRMRRELQVLSSSLPEYEFR